MTNTTCDAVVVGSAVRSSDEVSPGFVTDLFSAFYPMTAASPVMNSLDLEDHGLRWTHSPSVLAHVRRESPAAVLYRDAERTAKELDSFELGDGAPWLALAAEWDRFGSQMMDALLSPFPPIRAATKLAVAARLDLWDLIRRLVIPVRTMSAELFSGEMAPLLLAGNALHADLTPESAPSGLLGWMLVGLAQTVGFPVPVGGAGKITSALLSRFEAAGGVVRVNEPVDEILIEHGRAIGVRTSAGTVTARHAVLAACDAQLLYGRLVPESNSQPPSSEECASSNGPVPTGQFHGQDQLRPLHPGSVERSPRPRRGDGSRRRERQRADGHRRRDRCGRTPTCPDTSLVTPPDTSLLPDACRATPWHSSSTGWKIASTNTHQASATRSSLGRCRVPTISNARTRASWVETSAVAPASSNNN